MSMYFRALFKVLAIGILACGDRGTDKGAAQRVTMQVQCACPVALGGVCSCGNLSTCELAQQTLRAKDFGNAALSMM